MSVLDELVAGALEDQRSRECVVSLEDVRRAALAAPAPIDATRWLKRPDGIPVIAEIKRASPSKGHLSDIPDPAALAREYERGGASVISVLTEGRRFLARWTISTRSARRFTFRCCARTSSSPTTRSTRRVPTAPT